MPFKKPSEDGDQSGGLIPFGKYRGKPIEAMIQDPAYCEWFMSQPEMRQKYGNVYQVIVNNFGEPSETPESNEIQGKFLSEHFRLQFAKATMPSFFEMSGNECIGDAAEFIANQIFEAKKQLGKERLTAFYGEDFWRLIRESTQEVISSVAPFAREVGIPAFESRGTDVTFAASSGGIEFKEVDFTKEGWARGSEKTRHWGHRRHFLVEIKPSVGDDYPAILRQMRRSQANVLFIRDYTGIGVDEPTFIEYFATQGIRVVFEHDVLNQEIPEPLRFNGEAIHNVIKWHLEALENA